ncbi:MAG: sodium:alanine symporter family protein [Alphaproteobacteria bacterium]|jgi:alanine or glycine:cation symporter, AGCS family|nr:sodium:alanine symporter family protein [Alphaproteobacteria bacterium]MBT5390208.1 sodium:alanine symporter family protein [Alphaproteobacteria bacterium]MBT5540751.1 sodium:alanine symporter family protein [Alphaproteobacteria bacterium]MBT5654649.1 sodium:alanine symporter family protein [Alphaproteobacteria bacterium]
MFELAFDFLEEINDFLWGYIGAFLILSIGLFFTVKSRIMQLREFPKIFGYFIKCFEIKKEKGPKSTLPTPIKAFFASLGGCVGIGNLVAVAIAVQVGGPGALVWVWIVAFLGMILKYSEIYLGIKYRKQNPDGTYSGGPMFFLSKAFPKLPWVPYLMASLLCIYGVEIFMFATIKESLVINWSLPPLWVSLGLLALILFSVRGGVQRIGNISGIMISVFIVVYLGMTGWVLWQNLDVIPEMFFLIFSTAFTGHAAVGGFAGSTLLIAMSKGISSACYSGDVGIGYASIIHSEAKTDSPEKQASLSIAGIFLDTFVVCTCTILLLLSTGVWTMPIEGSLLVQTALGKYFPYMNIFMPIFLFALGFSTIIAYMFAGLKSARFIFPTYGEKAYYVFATASFMIFSFFDARYALTVMYISGGLLMTINLPAILKLWRSVVFDIR